jgi:PAS domain S-box-containing protein
MSNISTSESAHRRGVPARGLTLAASRRPDGHGWGRHTTLAVLTIGLIISVTVFFAIRQQTMTHLADNLGIQAGRTTETIQRRIRVVEDATRALGAHFSASHSVTPEEFSDFVDHILPEENGVDLLFWASQSTVGTASRYSVGPMAKEAHLAALNNSPGLRVLIATALAGRPMTTAVIDGPALGLADERMLAVAVPTREGRSGAITGATVGLVSFDALFRRPSKDHTGMRMPGLRIYDMQMPDVMLYTFGADPETELAVLLGSAIHQSFLVLGDRLWIAEFNGVVLNLPPLLAFAPVGTLFGSLVVTLVLAAYFNATQRRARDIRALAASLARTNHELQRQIDEHCRTAAALSESERKYRDIYENAVEGIFQTSPDGRMLSANPALARIYGYETPEEALEALQDVSQQLYVDPTSRTEFVRLLEKQDVIYSFESEITRKDGRRIWID